MRMVASGAEMLQFWYNRADNDVSTKQISASVPPETPYHDSIEALMISAESCPLWAVVQVGVRAWIDAWNDAAKNDKSFIEFSLEQDRIAFTEQLWLTQCHNKVNGFCVWVGKPRNLK